MLLEIVKDDGLFSDCKACCVKDDAKAQKYARATLEICPSRKAGLPQIADFIDKRAKAFGPRLRVREAYGAYPRLVLTGGGGGSGSGGGGGGGGQERVSIRIDQWKAAHIEEYLRDRLLLPEAADDKSGGGGSGGSSGSGGGKKKKKKGSGDKPAAA